MITQTQIRLKVLILKYVKYFVCMFVHVCMCLVATHNSKQIIYFFFFCKDKRKTSPLKKYGTDLSNQSSPSKNKTNANEIKDKKGSSVGKNNNSNAKKRKIDDMDSNNQSADTMPSAKKARKWYPGFQRTDAPPEAGLKQKKKQSKNKQKIKQIVSENGKKTYKNVCKQNK